MQPTNLPSEEWLLAPYFVRLFILKWLCEKGKCGEPITLDTCNELLKAFSHNYSQNHSLSSYFSQDDSTLFENVIMLDNYMIAWDGDSALEIAWYHTRTILQKELSRPTYHEYLTS